MVSRQNSVKSVRQTMGSRSSSVTSIKSVKQTKDKTPDNVTMFQGFEWNVRACDLPAIAALLTLPRYPQTKSTGRG